MKITKTSELTGITRTLDLPVTEDQIQVWLDGMLIQAAMPNLDADQREFVKTGITPDEWDSLYPDEDPEDHDALDESMDGDHDSAMISVGWGTDEDYFDGS